MLKKILNKEKLWNIIGYTPTQNQLDVHDSVARFRVNIQGRRSGKSFSAAAEALPYLLTPNTRGWVVAPNYELCDKVARLIKEYVILHLKLPIAAKKEISGQIYYLKLQGLNSELWIKSCDNPDSLVGEGLDWMIIDEAARVKQIVWEQYLRPTLSDRGGWCLFTTTPLGYNWLYDLYVRGQSKEYPDWASWQHASWESPYFKEDLDELKKTLTKETLAQEFGAEFTSFAGKVYDFDRRVHITKHEYDPDLPTYCSIDFGFRMPCVNWFQVKKSEEEDGIDTIYVFDEICHEENVKTEDLAKLVWERGYDVRRYFCDPAGGGVQAQSGIGDIEIFKRHGINVQFKRDKISRNIANGVAHVRTWFEDAHGKPHIFYDEKCKGSISSIENYRYPEKKTDQRLKEEPLKDGRNDHHADTLRYFIVNLYPIKQNKAGTLEW